jgi:hypothetical protein
MSGRLKVKLLVTLPAGTMEELLTPAHHRHAIGLQVRRHLQHAHGMRSLCKGRRSGVGLHAEVKDVKSAKSLLNHMIEAKEFERPAEPEQWIPAVEDGVSTDRTYRLL